MSTPSLFQEEPLPPGWKWTELGDVCNVVNGSGFPTRYQGQTSLPFPFVKVSDMNTSGNGVIINSAASTVDDGILDAIRARVCPPGTVIFPKVGGAVFTNKKRILGTESAFDNNIMGLVPINVLSDWLYYCLQALELASLANIQALPSIKAIVVKGTSIPLPPLADQKRIVGVLNEQMAAVERLEAAQALREALLERVFDSSEALAWPETTISDLCVISSRQVDPRLKEYKDLPHVNGENIESGSGRILYLKSSAELGMRSGKYLFRKGDVLYSKLRPYLRKATVADFDGLCSADMYPLTPIASRVTKEFLSLVLLTSKFTEYADGESKRSRMPKLNRKQLMRWKQRIPPISRQRAIVERLNSQRQYADAVKRDTEETIAEIEAMPSALLRRAFSGEV